MARTCVWVSAFLMLCCQLCAVYGDNEVGPSPSSSSSDGGSVAMPSDTTTIEDDYYDHDSGTKTNVEARQCRVA